VTGEIAEWAIAFVERDVATMATRFQRGEVGTGDHRAEQDIRLAVEAFLAMSPEKRAQYKVSSKLLEGDVIPFHYLRRRLRVRTAFKNDRRGAAKALEDALADLVKAEILQAVPQQQAIECFGVRSELYAVGPCW